MQRGVDACETEPGESEDERRKGLEHVGLFVAPHAARARIADLLSPLVFAEYFVILERATRVDRKATLMLEEKRFPRKLP